MRKLANNRVSLLNALDNDPKSWDWNGVCNDRGHASSSCACGHIIRYEFPLVNRNTGKQIIVGCVCVENYDIFPESVIEAMKAKIEEAKRIEKEAQQNDEIQQLLIAKEKIDKLINAYAESIRIQTKSNYLPYDVWEFMVRGRKLKDVTKYKKLGAYIKALKKYIQISIAWYNVKKEIEEFVETTIPITLNKTEYGITWVVTKKAEKKYAEFHTTCDICKKALLTNESIHYHYINDDRLLEHVNCKKEVI